MGRTFYTTKTTDRNKDVAALCLRSALKAKLLALPFAAFARCVCDLLEAEGYTQVQLAGRASYRGRNKEGGFDIEAHLPSPLSQKEATGSGVLRRKVIIQAKQFPAETRIYQRNLDELRGACLRTGAIEAVLVTTSDFSSVVRNVELALRRDTGSGNLAPVHLLNGKDLVERLIVHRIGVSETNSTDSSLSLDPAYFDQLKAKDQPSKAVNVPGLSDRRCKPERPQALCARVSRNQTELTVTLPLTLFTVAKNGKGGA